MTGAQTVAPRTEQLATALGAARVVDLSRPIESATPHSPHHAPFLMALLRRHGDAVREGGLSGSNELISMGAHTATHIDALSHISLARPVHGRHAVWTTLRTSAGIYDRLRFTSEAAHDGRVYLEWTGTAVGVPVDGVTILVLDDQGQFVKVAIHHRPLAAVLAFSAEMAKRLSEGPGADHFYQVP